MNDNKNKAAIPTELAALCEATGTRKEGVAALMKYYTETCEWTQTQAIEHIIELFENGTIDLIKAL